MKRLLLAAVLLLPIGAGPCSDSTDTKTSDGGSTIARNVEGEGTIGLGVGPECPQTWHIATSDGRILWPVNDPAFQQEGLRVRYTVRERPDMSSICMAGVIVDVISLRKI
jgi:hypothetical protein